MAIDMAICGILNQHVDSYETILNGGVRWIYQHLLDLMIFLFHKVEKILKGSRDSIPSPLPSVKIQIIGGKVCFRCKSKTLLGVVNKLLITKSLLTSPSNVLPYYLK